MTRPNFVLSLLAAASSAFLLACNPDDVIQEYFAKAGLNQLLTPRADIIPGAVFLTYDGKPSYADNIMDYAIQTSEMPVSMSDATPEVNAVLGSLTQSVDSSLAIDFLGRFLPIASGSVTLTNDISVSISPIMARFKRMRIPTITAHLASEDSEEFRRAMDDFHRTYDNLRVTIAYEVYRTKRMRIASTEGSNVAVGMTIGVTENESGYKYTKESERVLEFEGDISYAFAVRAALMIPDDASQTQPRQYVLAQLSYVPRDDRLASLYENRADVQYSASVVGDDFEQLDLVPLTELRP